MTDAPERGALRVTEGVVAVYRPDRGTPDWPPVRNPWHCYNVRTGEFIECRTDEDVAGYHKLPGDPEPPWRHVGFQVGDGNTQHNTFGGDR